MKLHYVAVKNKTLQRKLLTSKATDNWNIHKYQNEFEDKSLKTQFEESYRGVPNFIKLVSLQAFAVNPDHRADFHNPEIIGNGNNWQCLQIQIFVDSGT